MKLKLIVAACAAVCSVSSFAQVITGGYNPNTPVTGLQTYYMGGATAQLPGVAYVIGDFFDSSVPVTWIYEGTGKAPNNPGIAGYAFPANPNPSPASTGNNVNAWYGKAGPNTPTPGAPLLVIYNQNAGSMTGLVQILNTLGAAPTQFPASWTKVPTVGSNIYTCSPAILGTGATANVSACYTNSNASDAYTPMDLALSDVYAAEAVPGTFTAGSGGLSSLTSNITQVTTGLEGFGIAVNAPLYQALQSVQGLTVGSLTAANQPSINSADYLSLISPNGNSNSAVSDFIKNASDSNPMVLERRTNWSGTQAASDMFFANSPCGLLSGTGSTLAAQIVYDDGAQTGTVGPVALGNNINYYEQASTGNIKNALTAYSASNTTGLSGGAGGTVYGLGIVSLENAPTSTSATSWQFVKLDGISPNWLANGTYDTTQRVSTQSGAYKFAVEMNAYYHTNSSNTFKGFDAIMTAALTDSTKHNLTGVSYLDGANANGVVSTAVASQQARYIRNGSNCNPLMNWYY